MYFKLVSSFHMFVIIFLNKMNGQSCKKKSMTTNRYKESTKLMSDKCLVSSEVPTQKPKTLPHTRSTEDDEISTSPTRNGSPVSILVPAHKPVAPSPLDRTVRLAPRR
jgi:hypothetical protein